ncbi:hypothetical protein LX97_03430 [Nonlabens dokdonensis]|jgi:hypothetical protein|uniref:Outer membrane protein beta-barrel domain-containing protein n=2 Tax=Nonlabens dokdonensis TaxID=328515 RepID=L7WD89_NONDD|nr:hypothetical protein [Nonlabens dokdonensis]AGC77891.1 hypothetical protein DDD_2764 [Nonlabens dokdonensis DSW-6]PZX36673.1 hypothetical protein LX97_03430 [Nonlabens dokdonensis]
MKNILMVSSILISMTSIAQTFEIGAGAGSGAFYFIEDIDANAVAAYDSPASLYLDVKYNFKDRIDGLKLRLQNTSVNVVGNDYQTLAPIDGTVEMFTTSLLYERLRTDKKFNVGYNAGMGITHQEFVRIKNMNLPPREDKFMTLSFDGIFTLRLDQNLRLNLNTGLLWTDPMNTFRGSDNWQTAGEDLSFLAQIGISYKFN